VRSRVHAWPARRARRTHAVAARIPRIDLGLGLAASAACLSFAIAFMFPHFLNMFWQIPDGLDILRGHIPTTIAYAISAEPLVAQEWLFEAALAWCAQHNVYGVFLVVCAAAAAATPLIVYAAVRAFGIGDVPAGIVALLVIGSRFAGSAVRPETFAVDAFALELFVLGRARNRWWILPVVVLWANVHASVVLAPIAALAVAAGEWFAHRSFNTKVRGTLVAAASIALATLATPHGTRLWSYAFNLAVASNPTREHLDAWRALAFDAPGALASVLPGLLLLIVFGIQRRRRYASEILIGALCLALTFMHARYSMFLAAGWAPMIARTLDRQTPFAASTQPRPRISSLAILPIIILSLLTAIPKFSTPLEPAGPWQSAASIITDHNLHGNTYAPYTWAAYLHWRKLPVRLLIDAHGDPYPKDIWNDHLSLEKAAPNWREVLTRRQIQTIVIPEDSPLSEALKSDPTWQKVETRKGITAYVSFRGQLRNSGHAVPQAKERPR
jgi:hypothetical protein